MAKKLYPPVEAGQKVEIKWRMTDYKIACCDCNLVHRFRFTVKGKLLVVQGWRDNHATAQLRRRRGVPIKMRSNKSLKPTPLARRKSQSKPKSRGAA